MMLPRREIAPAATAAPDYSHFLYAELWIEASGMPLSVMSALARLGVDGQREAFRLASLPRVAAGITLSKTIAELPDHPAAADIAGTAARLVKLLPDVHAAAGKTAAGGATERRGHFSSLRGWQLALIAALTAWLIYGAVTRPASGDGPPQSVQTSWSVPGAH